MIQQKVTFMTPSFHVACNLMSTPAVAVGQNPFLPHQIHQPTKSNLRSITFVRVGPVTSKSPRFSKKW